MHTKTKLVVFFLFSLWLASCNHPKNDKPAPIQKQEARKDQLSHLLSLDTLSSDEYKKAIFREYDLLQQQADSNSNPFFHYYKARKYNFEDHRNLALAEFKQMKSKKAGDEIDVLKRNSLLDQQTNDEPVVGAGLMDTLLLEMQAAERLHSRLTYRYYDLIAKAYYLNSNNQKSLEYAKKYYESHPYKWHPVIKQRFYDISFLLAAKLGDYPMMLSSNAKARSLAFKIGDSIAIARTYDNEAQIYDRQGRYDKVLECSRIYFNYLKRTGNLNHVAYNNLAASFLGSNQPDSAIYYAKEGIAFYRKNLPGKHKSFLYEGLADAYKKKGNYKEALIAIDSAHAIEIRNIKDIEAVKIAELEQKYKTEKKDRDIAELNNRNGLNEKIIRQQRWSLGLSALVFLGLLYFLYVIYKQQQLKATNKLLQSENKRLEIEQKLLQAQLNPHFIFNSIANLQGLMSKGDTTGVLRYLGAFSKLLRSILEQSRKDFIDLQEEIATLENYLQVQQMRFTDVFEYEIVADEHLDLEQVMLPPMLVQPFVENAIEHGFRNISYMGKLSISFEAKHGELHIKLEDNGQGLGQKATNGTQKQSLAQVIQKERLDVLFKSKGQEAKFEVIDKGNGEGHGVLVQIAIPLIKD